MIVAILACAALWLVFSLMNLMAYYFTPEALSSDKTFWGIEAFITLVVVLFGLASVLNW